ncbi:MAG TPA: DNRLRE domain-containing protein [Planctomycetota bacterium]|nr:DNRLRE domain-containing protein [Planctomycetota bacterium]
MRMLFLVWIASATLAVFSADPIRFKVATYNIHAGDGYRRTDGTVQERLDRIVNILDGINADIIGLQEITNAKATGGQPLNQPAYIAQKLGERHGRQYYYHLMPVSPTAHGTDQNVPPDQRAGGPAIISRFRILHVTYITMKFINDKWGERRGCLAATLEVPGANAPITALCTHLTVNTSAEQPAQVVELMDFMKMFPRPAVLVGDFNFDPAWGGQNLVNYNNIVANYTDAWREIWPNATARERRTRITSSGNDATIDNIFYSRSSSPRLQCTGAWASNADAMLDLSDHFPAWCEFEWDGSGFGETTAPGSITCDHFANISGTSVSALTGNAAYPDGWTSTGALQNYFQSAVNSGENYGQRIRGFITAPESGGYRFWVASANDSELWLSTDEDPAHIQKVASVGQTSSWPYPCEWGRLASQESALITLQANTRYYIEVRHKAGAGWENLAVGWKLPSGRYERPIPQKRLSPYTPPNPPPPSNFITLESVADSTVRSGAYASNNEGTDTGLMVKLSSADFTRESYIRFDLSNVPGNILSAQLRLQASAIGPAGSQAGVALVENDAWAETGITWNNKPASAAVLGTVTGAIGTASALDVTAAAQAQSDGLLSLRVYSPNANSDHWVKFAAREHATLAAPQLVITYNERPAIVSLSATPNPAVVNETVTLSAAATDADGDTVAYTWNFGDGTPASTGATVQHAFAAGNTYSVTVTVNDGRGGTASQSLNVVVQAQPSITLMAEADALVRGGAYAGSNFGATSQLTVKLTTNPDYTRESFLRFDTSSVAGTITSAKVRLRIETTDTANAFTHSARFVSSNSWAESAITWNSKPAAGSVLKTWSPNTVGNGGVVEIDVTSQVQAARSGDKKISLSIGANEIFANGGGWTNYGSREGAASLRPELIVVGN